MNSSDIYLGLGSNTGRRSDNIRKAVREIKGNPHFSEVRVSYLYETKPVGPEQRDFVNAALFARTDLEPAGLLKLLKRIEHRLGRKKSAVKWGPRSIDIDILLYGDRLVDTRTLKIPHIELPKRLFALIPLCDIAPDLRHPALKKTLRGLRNELLLTYSKQKDKIPVCRIK